MGKQALVNAACSYALLNKAILHSCIGILMFGVLNRGLNNENLLSLTKDKKSAPFIVNLMEGSELLGALHRSFLPAQMKSCFVVSFYKTKDTRTLTVSSVFQ